MLALANIFQPLIDVFQSILQFFHNHMGVSWGFSIVLLTILIRAVLVPLTVKQYHSMQRLQRLQPEMKAIQNKYKDDKQRQQQELMKFYRENNVNPLGSCLPLVLQIPVFISLYYMLRQDLRPNICPGVQAAHHLAPGHTVPCGAGHGAGFLFIPDLTNTATGAVLVALIVLYVGTQLASSLLMTTTTMDQTQRRIMLLMPLFFVIFIINFPAGVIVYWITTNTWTIGQQYVVRRRLGPMGAKPASAGAQGTDGGGPREQPATVPDGSPLGGLGGLLRGRQKPAKEPAAVGAASRPRGAPPPPPPRKKKKRSGRRR